MTFMYMVSCLLLTLGVPYVVYKSTKLSVFAFFRLLSRIQLTFHIYGTDMGAKTVCFYGGVAYTLTQLSKLILVATLLPTTSDGQTVDFVEELFKLAVTFLDAVGIYLILRSKTVTRALPDNEARLLAIGVGWAVAEAILLRFFPIVGGARATEFSWTYLNMSVESSLNILVHVSLVAVVWLHSRADLESDQAKLISVLLAALCLAPALVNLAQTLMAFGGVEITILRAIVYTGLALISQQQIRSYSTSTKRAKSY